VGTSINGFNSYLLSAPNETPGAIELDLIQQMTLPEWFKCNVHDPHRPEINQRARDRETTGISSEPFGHAAFDVVQPRASAKLFFAFFAGALHQCGNSANRVIESSPRMWVALWLENDEVSLVATHGKVRRPLRFAGPSEGVAIQVLTWRHRFAGHDCETGRAHRLRKRYKL